MILWAMVMRVTVPILLIVVDENHHPVPGTIYEKDAARSYELEKAEGYGKLR
jgi:hypothetical protein